MWNLVTLEDGSFLFEFYTESFIIVYAYYQLGYMLINNLQLH